MAIKTFLFLYYNTWGNCNLWRWTDHCISTWKQCHFINNQSWSHIDTLTAMNFYLMSTSFFLCNFDGRTIDVVLTYIFDIISMGGKMTQLQRVCRLLSLFGVISMHFNIFYVFFKVISFHLEIPCVMIAQCLRTVTPADICSDLTCLQLQWFSADILWNFPGSDQRRHPLSVSCRFMKMSMRDFFLQQL